jgi:hypothetical protein
MSNTIVKQHLRKGRLVHKHTRVVKSSNVSNLSNRELQEKILGNIDKLKREKNNATLYETIEAQEELDNRIRSYKL